MEVYAKNTKGEIAILSVELTTTIEDLIKKLSENKKIPGDQASVWVCFDIKHPVVTTRRGGSSGSK